MKMPGTPCAVNGNTGYGEFHFRRLPQLKHPAFPPKKIGMCSLRQMIRWKDSLSPFFFLRNICKMLFKVRLQVLTWKEILGYKKQYIKSYMQQLRNYHYT